VRLPAALIMKRFIAAISLAVLAGSAFAADHSGPLARSPLVRPLPAISDPLMDSASAGASLPDLGSTDAAKFGDLQRRPLPGERAPLVGERPRYLGPKPYWENDPLFIAPLR
jgi:hypothetical protein